MASCGFAWLSVIVKRGLSVVYNFSENGENRIGKQLRGAVDNCEGGIR